ncbi:MAG: hypothetical protein L0Y56_22025 [Nitrospira sp.]|nr:hypothetical protein [Nitrospira sp.]
MDAEFKSRLRALWARGFSQQAIADSLDVTVGVVCAVATLLDLKPVPKISMDAAMEDMGLSEAYREYVRQVDRKRRTSAARDAVPVLDRGPWGEYLLGEEESKQEKNQRRRLVAEDRTSLREGFNF